MKTMHVSIIVLVVIAVCGHAFAKGPKAETKLDEALASAKADGKLLFIQFGRESCGNCQALKSYIATSAVKLQKDRFIYVDLDCDNPDASQSFYKHFKVEGRMLPFVVIADSEGKQLVSRTGYGTPVEFKKLIKEANKKVPEKLGDTSGPKTTTGKPSGISTGVTAKKTTPQDD